MHAKKFKIFLCFFAVTAFLGSAVIAFLPKKVFFESIESKTEKGHPVFNEIQLETIQDKDVWTMKQSHTGPRPVEWDMIRIIVDKKEKPYQVQYQQIKNGEEVELKAVCLTCHANGPRAIRPYYESASVSNSMIDKAVVHLMNLKMKSYGKVKIAENNFFLKGEVREVPLKFFSKRDNQVLNASSCVLCHNNEHFWGRGELTKQNAGTIKHLVDTKQMPPWPFQLSADDRKYINDFTKSI